MQPRRDADSLNGAGRKGTPGSSPGGALPTGIARERETSADDVAPCQSEGRVFFMTGEGVQEDPIMRVCPGGGLKTGVSKHF